MASGTCAPVVVVWVRLFRPGVRALAGQVAVGGGQAARAVREVQLRAIRLSLADRLLDAPLCEGMVADWLAAGWSYAGDWLRLFMRPVLDLLPVSGGTDASSEAAFHIGQAQASTSYIGLLQLLNQRRHDLEEVADDPVVGGFKDGGVGVLVDWRRWSLSPSCRQDAGLRPRCRGRCRAWAPRSGRWSRPAAPWGANRCHR